MDANEITDNILFGRLGWRGEFENAAAAAVR